MPRKDCQLIYISVLLFLQRITRLTSSPNLPLPDSAVSPARYTASSFSGSTVVFVHHLPGPSDGRVTEEGASWWRLARSSKHASRSTVLVFAAQVAISLSSTAAAAITGARAKTNKVLRMSDFLDFWLHA